MKSEKRVEKLGNELAEIEAQIAKLKEKARVKKRKKTEVENHCLAELIQEYGVSNGELRQALNSFVKAKEANIIPNKKEKNDEEIS